MTTTREYEIGCQVKTPYGYGNVIEIFPPNKLCVEFDEWKLAGGSHPKMYTTSSQILYGSSYDLGTCVMTRYGPGILLNYQRTTNIHVIRLWRPRGLGSATAYMNQNDIFQKLKAFPGMKVVTTYGTGILEGYSASQNGMSKYIVKLNYGTAFLNEDAIQSCPEAKVFPTAEMLADKALGKIRSLNWGDSFLNTGSTTPIVNAMTTFWERVRSGETQIDDALAERAKQINDHLVGLDIKEMHKNLQNRVESIISEPGKIEMLLTEGKQRMLQLIESADKRNELAGDTKSALDDYLKTGKDQLDQAIEKVKSSSSESELKFIDTLQSLGSDVGGSLSVMKNLAESDPVMKELMNQINAASIRTVSKSKEAQAILQSSKTGQVLKTGGENLSQRLENILNSSSTDLSVVKGIGKQIMSTLEKQGSSEKGKAIFNTVKSRIVRKITSMDAEKSLSATIEEKLIAMLQTWKSGMADNANNFLATNLSQLTVLLTMMGDGSLGVEEIIMTTQKKILTTLNDPRFKKQASDIARDKLAGVLVSLKKNEEALTGKTVSGFHFYKEFNLNNLSDAKDTLKQTMKSIADHTGVSGLIDNMESPLLKDVTAPLGKIVTQIRNGNFDIDAAIQAAKESLDSELLENSALDLVARGEKVVSVLESIRSHDAVRDVLTKIQDLDIEKSISSRIMNFDADSVLDEAESAFSDKDARNRLLNSTKDQVLGFLLEHIPNMRIPDIQGVKDDVQFAVTRLDLSGFKLRKEDVTVSLGTSLNEEFVTCEARNISAAFNGVKWKYQQLYFPYLSGTGIADAAAQNASIRIGFKLVRVPRGTIAALAESAANSPDVGYNSGDLVYSQHPQIKEEVEKCRAELLTTSSTKDFRSQLRNSANMLKTPSTPVSVGKAQETATIWGNEVHGWEPVLILSSRLISMESLSIKIEDSSLSWLYNLLASVFTGIIRDYVCASLKDMLGQQSAVLLGKVNKTAVTYWPIIHKILKVDITSLQEATAHDVAALIGPPKPAGGPTEITPREYVMKFAESGPLGIQLDIFKTGIQEHQGSDPSQLKSTGSKVVITGAVEGSQAERVFEASGVRNFMQHATIVAVNGKSFKGVNEDGVINLLRGPRPLYITVRLSMNGWERLGIYRSIIAKEKSNTPVVTAPASTSSTLPINKRKLRVISVVFQTGPLGLKLKETKSCGGAVIITGFSRSENDEPFQAERTGLLSSGMVMLAVNGKIVFGRPFDDVMEVIKIASRPMKMVFVPSPDKQVTFDAPPTDLVLGRIEGYVMVAAFKSEIGPAQQQGGIFPGIVILQVNKVTITADMTLEEVEEMMRAPFHSPEESDKAPKVKLAVRDMDSFMHLIRIRDGEESLDDALDDETTGGTMTAATTTTTTTTPTR